MRRSKKAKEFIRHNRRLGVAELSYRTRLSRRQVRKVLAELEREQRGPLSRSVVTSPCWGVQMYIPALLVAVVTSIVYLHALSNDFVNWDDPESVLQNYHIQRLDGASIHWMFTTFHTGNWIPITWLSHAIDYFLWGLDPRFHHLTNLVLHSLNTALVFFLGVQIFVLARSVLPGQRSQAELQFPMAASSIAALIFGLHPLHVESVAWVTERKGLLCALFFLSSLLAYFRYASEFPRKPPWLGLCFVFFALALLSKPMAVTLPVVLLLLDAWPLGRFRQEFARAVIEKSPFIFLSVLVGLLTVKAQNAARAFTTLPLEFRILNAFHSVILYLEKTLVPFNLVPFYPIVSSERNPFTPGNLISVGLVVVISVACIMQRRRRPEFFWAWCYYLVTLAPVLGIVQVGSQAAADRYTYLPSVSLFLLLGGGIATLEARATPRLLVRPWGAAVVGIVLAAVLGPLTFRQIGIWKDSVTLWERVILAYPDVSQMAHTNLANAYRKVGRLDEALREYDRALALPPPHPFSHDGKGTALLDKGRVDEAIHEFWQAIALDPKYAPAYRNLWFAYNKKGMPDEAETAAQKAVEIEPDFAEAYSNLAISYGNKHQFKASEDALLKAIALEPDKPRFLANLATTYQLEGKLDKAIDLYRRAQRLDPQEPIYFINLGNTYLQKGMLAEAILELQKAVTLAPSNAEAHLKLADAYKKSGKTDLALEHYENAIRLGRKVDPVLLQEILEKRQGK